MSEKILTTDEQKIITAAHLVRPGQKSTCRLVGGLAALAAAIVLALCTHCPAKTDVDPEKILEIHFSGSDYWGIHWSDPTLAPIREELEKSVNKILILNSYHDGYWWSDAIMETIRSEFGKTDLNAELFFENMDTKRYVEKQAFAYTERLLRAKYSEVTFKVIIASDDGALSFLLKYGQDLFPGVPVVFCGVENIDRRELKGNRNFTGVVEQTRFGATVEIALNLHRPANRVVIVGDGTPSWLGSWQKDFEDLRERLGEKVEFVRLSFPELTMQQVTAELEQLGGESVIVILSLTTDATGAFFSLEEGIKTLWEHTRAPMYVFLRRPLGVGPVGGSLADPISQGNIAAEMAIRIINGEDVKDIPPVLESPNKYMFDYLQLCRFGVSISQLPKGSIIINQPESFYYRHKTEIWTITSVFAGLSTTIIILSVNVFRRKKAEKKLLDYQGQLKQLASELSTSEEQQRRRIGTKLHDQIGQELVISKIALETLCQDRPASDNIKETLRKVADSLDHTITEVRSLTFDLSSPILYELGLEAALAEWLSENIRHKHNIETEFHDDGREKPLDDDVRALLFRITQELLVNVIRHASAKKVRLSVGRNTDRMHIIVEDDGVGCSSAKLTSIPNRAGGFGLFNIKERLEPIGGKLDIDCAPGRGCKIKVVFPLEGKKTMGAKTS